MGATTRERLARSPTDVSWIMEIVHEKTALRRRGGCTCRSVGWPRIWTQNTVEPMRISGTQRDRLDGRTSLTCSYETECIGGDRDRLAHNPEVAGSNPVPATTVPATTVPATSPRYQRKWPPEDSPVVVFMPDGHVFGHVS
jgi:hypothetical protein